jgi:hypothetical protein
MYVSKAAPEILRSAGIQQGDEPPFEIDEFDITGVIWEKYGGMLLRIQRPIWCAPVISGRLLGLDEDDFDQYLRRACVRVFVSDSRKYFRDLVLQSQLLQSLHRSVRYGVNENPFSRGVRFRLDSLLDPFEERVENQWIDLHSVECAERIFIGPQQSTDDGLFVKMLHAHNLDIHAGQETGMQGV